MLFYSFVSGPARGRAGAVFGPLFFYGAVRLARLLGLLALRWFRSTFGR